MPTPQEKIHCLWNRHLACLAFVEQAGQPVHPEWYTAVSLTGLGDRAKIH